MVNVATEFPSVVRTDRGLSVGGRRLTLYFLEDHFKAGWPAELVKDWFNLSDQEIADVVGYIAAHREEFETEYREVARQADERRQFWEERNRGLLDELRTASDSSGKSQPRAKLDARRSGNARP